MKTEKEIVKSPAYPTINEFRSKKFLKIATALGISASTIAVPPNIKAEEKKAPNTQKESNIDNQKLKEQITLLAANLGHAEGQKRESATKSMITLGKKFEKNKNCNMTAFIKAILEKCKKDSDPEIKERAKLILIAITPPPPNRKRGIATGGVMISR